MGHASTDHVRTISHNRKMINRPFRFALPYRRLHAARWGISINNTVVKILWPCPGPHWISFGLGRLLPALGGTFLFRQDISVLSRLLPIAGRLAPVFGRTFPFRRDMPVLSRPTSYWYSEISDIRPSQDSKIWTWN